FACGEKPIVEGLKHWIVGRGDQCAHVQDASDLAASTPDGPLASQGAAIPVQRGNADEARDLLAVEPPQLGELGQEDGCQPGSDTGNAAVELGARSQARRGLDQGFNRLVQQGLLLLQVPDGALEAGADSGAGSRFSAV